MNGIRPSNICLRGDYLYVPALGNLDVSPWTVRAAMWFCEPHIEARHEAPEWTIDHFGFR